MLGWSDPLPGASTEPVNKGESSIDWRSVVFMPVTFPLTFGGTTFAIMVSFRAEAKNTMEIVALTVAVLCYAAVTGITLFASGHVDRRVSEKTRVLLERIAGILLTAIAAHLLASGIPRMVVDTLRAIEVMK
jgi:multiple antibiotic resistance protein